MLIYGPAPCSELLRDHNDPQFLLRFCQLSFVKNSIWLTEIGKSLKSYDAATILYPIVDGLLKGREMKSRNVFALGLLSCIFLFDCNISFAAGTPSRCLGKVTTSGPTDYTWMWKNQGNSNQGAYETCKSTCAAPSNTITDNTCTYTKFVSGYGEYWLDGDKAWCKCYFNYMCCTSPSLLVPPPPSAPKKY